MFKRLDTENLIANIYPSCKCDLQLNLDLPIGVLYSDFLKIFMHF